MLVLIPFLLIVPPIGRAVAVLVSQRRQLSIRCPTGPIVSLVPAATLMLSASFAIAAEPRQVHVLVSRNGECRVVTTPVPCDEVGEFIKLHSLAHAIIVVDGHPQANYRFIGAVLKSLSDANIPKIAFGHYPEDGT